MKTLKIGRYKIAMYFRKDIKRDEVTVPYDDAELLPCPFCGGEAEYRNNFVPTHYIMCKDGVFGECSSLVVIGCDHCTVYDCTTDKKTELCEYLIWGWNKRSSDD